MLKVRKIAFKTAHYTLCFPKIKRSETLKSILIRSVEFWLVQYCFVAKGMSCLISSMSVGYVNTRDDHNSGESETFLYAVKWRVSWSWKLQSINWLVRQIQKSAWHKEPQHSRRETFSSRRNCWTLFTKAEQSNRGKTADTGTNLQRGRNWTVVEMFTAKNSHLMSREISSWIQKSQRPFYGPFSTFYHFLNFKRL